MDEILPPVGDEELRHVNNKHLRGRRAASAAHVLQDHGGDVTVGGRQQGERHRNARRPPLAQDHVFFLVVGHDRDELDGGGRGDTGGRDRAHRGTRERGHQDEGAHAGRQRAPSVPVVDTQLLAGCLVVAVNRDLEAECDRDHEQRDPRAVRELGGQHDEKDSAGHHEADDVDGARAQHRHTFLAGLTGAQLPVPVLNHAQLREREGDEDAHDVQLDESGGLGMESDDQRDGGEREDHDAVGVGEAVAAAHHLVGQEGVAREDRGQGREAVEGGVSGQNQDESRDDRNKDEQDGSVPEDGRGDLRDRGIDRHLVADGNTVNGQLRSRVLHDLDARGAREEEDRDHHGGGDPAQHGQGRRGVA